ncbi:glycosyltransferase family 4 protein [Pseudooceanicola sp.]|uniref:glycosyltransferase family 4 protein n=1 Tax=Pseudooceanicola sp. TaxID=1914328 RepID=UPI0035C6BE88
MPGGGIRLATTTNNPPPTRLLDLTRLASRPGRQPTGIDRVEMAYLQHLLDLDAPIWGLVRLSVGYVLLDRGGLTSFLHRVQGQTAWGKPRLLLRLARRLTPLQRQVQSDLWRLAAFRVLGRRLPRLLTHLPTGIGYLNVGHSNLTEHTLNALDNHPDTRITVMIHDTIPLDHPEYSQPEAVDRFRGLLRRVMHHADLILCNSIKTREDVQRHMAEFAKEESTEAEPSEETITAALPRMVITPLGITMPRPDPAALPVDLPEDRPLFVVLGTIEPRKNHKMLVEIWEKWDEKEDGPRPVLGIIGARGWRNEDLFDRLNRTPLRGRDLFEWQGLPDKAVAAVLARANALLFPSFAEGYGLPPVEAAALQTPVISADLPSVKESLGDFPVYLDAGDSYSWKKAIKSRVEVGRSVTEGMRGFAPPFWEEHFKVVLKMT